MKKYIVFAFGTPPAFRNSENPPLGIILKEILSISRPRRDTIQKKETNSGFKGYVEIMESTRFDKRYNNQDVYFYKNQ